MSSRAAVDSDSDDTLDITEFTKHGKRLKNSRSAWTSEVPKTMREEIEVAETEAAFYQGILDVIIAHLDPDIEAENIERLVLPPRVPNDVRKKLRKYRVEAKNIIEYINENTGDEKEDEKRNEDEKAEAIFLTTLIEKLCSALKQDTISSKFKLPRVPVVNVERKDVLKQYRKDANEIVQCLKRLKTQKIDKVTQTDFPQEDKEVRQTRVTEYINSASSTKSVPETKKKKIIQRTRQTQTDFDEHAPCTASVLDPIGKTLGSSVHPPSYNTVLSDYKVTQDGVAVTKPEQVQHPDLLQTIKGVDGRNFKQHQDANEQQYQHHHYHTHSIQQQQQQQQQQQRVMDDVVPNRESRNTADQQDRLTDGHNAQHDQPRQNRSSDQSSGRVMSGLGDDRPLTSDNDTELSNYLKQTDGSPTDKSSRDYINMLEAHNFKLSCRVSLLESQLHDSQRSLVVSAYSNQTVLDRVSDNIRSSVHEPPNLHDIHSTSQPSTRELSDLADRYRPIKLAEKFAKLYDREWVDIFTFETTDMKKSEQNAITDILEVIQSIYQMCARLSQEQIEDWQDQIMTVKRSELPEFLRHVRKLKDDALSAALKQTQKEMAVDSIPNIRQEIVTNEALASFYGPELASCEEFVLACVDVCWLMTVSDPPILLDFTCKNGSKFDKDVYSVYTKTGKKVDFLVWPPVYGEGQLLYKGVVQLM
ncbi:uncharacterized protein LOC132550195 [Ylistrum balloti]|uniref:uncharacterized protein LOC132550195 n=1 Tax=Ylistrum balloti TaxID=509963 RepID=UPI002905AA11|nr:uncharacterized protein LOC132550195 [Ylistrum balloti]